MKLDPIPDGSQPSLNVSLPKAPPSSPASSLSFPRCPGETPHAFGAFTTFFQLGHSRSLKAVADTLGEGLPTDRVYGQPRAAASQQPSNATAVDAENSKTGNLR